MCSRPKGMRGRAVCGPPLRPERVGSLRGTLGSGGGGPSGGGGSVPLTAGGWTVLWLLLLLDLV